MRLLIYIACVNSVYNYTKSIVQKDYRKRIGHAYKTDLSLSTVVPTKSDSDVIFCLQLLSKALVCTFHLSHCESIDHLFINPILCG